MEMPDVGPLNPTRLVAIPYPDVPSDIGNRLDELIRTHEHTVRALRESAELLESIQRQTTGAVQQVLATSQGQATQALADTWHPAQSDFRQAHQGMRGAASHLDTATELLLQQVPTIQAAMGTVEMLRSTGGYVSAMKADGVRADIDRLNTALMNIGLILDVAAAALKQLNGGWTLACATGFDPNGSVVPAFAPHAFESSIQGGQMNIKRGSRSGADEPSEETPEERRIKKTGRGIARASQDAVRRQYEQALEEFAKGKRAHNDKIFDQLGEQLDYWDIINDLDKE